MKSQSPPSTFSPRPFTGRLPRQVQRTVPLYAVCVLLIFLLISSTHTIGNSQTTAASSLLRRIFNPTSQSSATQIGFPPLGTRMRFPKKFWQIWKVDPLHYDDRDLGRAKTWPALNPSYRYEVLTDNNDLQWVEQYYGPMGLNRPDVVYVYRTLSAKIVKADLLRYMIMYIEGGVYADIDVEALRPVEEWIPGLYRMHERSIDMVVGIEADQPAFKDHPLLGSKSMSFVQWTFMCKPRLPVMLRLINNILAWLDDLAKKQGVPISDIVLGFDDIISGTGPAAFTNAILAEMSIKDARPLTWDTFHNISEPVLVGGVLVLRPTAFAAGQGHSGAEDHDSPEALIRHHYHASGWPKKHPRYSHVIYGEVEYCNWDMACVRKWDADKLAFEAMTKELQDKTVADQEAIWKQAADAQEAEREAEEKAVKDEEERVRQVKLKETYDAEYARCNVRIKEKYGFDLDNGPKAAGVMAFTKVSKVATTSTTVAIQTKPVEVGSG